jgi:hypothetical protein
MANRKRPWWIGPVATGGLGLAFAFGGAVLGHATQQLLFWVGIILLIVSAGGAMRHYFGADLTEKNYQPLVLESPSQEKPPDEFSVRSWDHLDRLKLYEAACLWVNEPPPSSSDQKLPHLAIPHLAALKLAVNSGSLSPIKGTDAANARLVMGAATLLSGKVFSADADTYTDRAALRLYAETHDGRPAFLFPDEGDAHDPDIESPNGWSVSVAMGGAITGIDTDDEHACIIFPDCRFVNIATTRHRIIDFKAIFSFQDPENTVRFNTRMAGVSGYQAALEKILNAGAGPKRMFQPINFPLKLAPGEMAEGQIIFSYRGASKLINRRVSAGSEATFEIFDNVSTRAIIMKSGQYYDAHSGRMRARPDTWQV